MTRWRSPSVRGFHFPLPTAEVEGKTGSLVYGTQPRSDSLFRQPKDTNSTDCAQHFYPEVRSLRLTGSCLRRFVRNCARDLSIDKRSFLHLKVKSWDVVRVSTLIFTSWSSTAADQEHSRTGKFLSCGEVWTLSALDNMYLEGAVVLAKWIIVDFVLCPRFWTIYLIDRLGPTRLYNKLGKRTLVN
ncbi:hypothetical protein R1flu_002233 [Riccia fluitans]|uniref:Uncharacterized protein n=1 Tax=Riccia fluitans TaxID=41844 RepID=A0ABD1Y5I1_9MARC